MKPFHLFGFFIGVVFGSSISVTTLDFVFVCFLDGSRIFKEPVRHVFGAFSRSCILLEFGMISFLPIITYFLHTFL